MYSCLGAKGRARGAPGDSDDDGLTDGAEVSIHRTDPEDGGRGPAPEPSFCPAAVPLPPTGILETKSLLGFHTLVTNFVFSQSSVGH